VIEKALDKAKQVFLTSFIKFLVCCWDVCL